MRHYSGRRCSERGRCRSQAGPRAESGQPQLISTSAAPFRQRMALSGSAHSAARYCADPRSSAVFAASSASLVSQTREKCLQSGAVDTGRMRAIGLCWFSVEHAEHHHYSEPPRSPSQRQTTANMRRKYRRECKHYDVVRTASDIPACLLCNVPLVGRVRAGGSLNSEGCGDSAALSSGVLKYI